jgi:hypothetical protein
VLQRFLDRAAEIHAWAPNSPWVRHPTGEYLSRRPAHVNACDGASPTEGFVVAVAAEIQDAQTANEAFGIDAVADSLGDADATHTAGTTVQIGYSSVRSACLIYLLIGSID